MNSRPADTGGSPPGMRGTALHDRFVLAVAALFVCAHLAWLPRHLEDIDSINFALGLRHYDVAAHQPHPPGYPVFIALARAVARGSCRRSRPTSRRATRSRWPCIAGLSGAVRPARCCIASCAALARRAGGRAALPPAAVWSPRSSATTPLFWVTASRPLSDMPGLAGALACQWLLLRAGAPRRVAGAMPSWRRWRAAWRRACDRR